MKRIILVVFFILGALTIQAQDKVNWISFNKALELNKTTPKAILVDVYTDWCGPCKRMDKLVYQNDKIASFINENYYAVKLNGEGKDSVAYQGKEFKFVTYNDKYGREKISNEFAQAILNTGKKMGGKSAYPTTAFFNNEAKMIQAVSGSLSKEEFEKILAYFKDPNYSSVPWAEFQKNFKSSF